MITTIDGETRYHGEHTWKISFDKDNGGYYPESWMYMNGDDTEIKLWDDYNFCAEQCRLMNQDKNI